MKKLALPIFLLVVAIGCKQNPDTLEAKQKLLDEKQKQLVELKSDIHKLKDEIASMDTSASTITADLTKVTTKTITPETFKHYVELTGTVTSKQNVLISAEAGGRVESIPVREGEKVNKGAVLVHIENSAAQDQLAEAKSGYELAKTTYEKRKNLWDQNIGSEIEYLQAKNNYQAAQSRYEQAQVQYDKTMIKAPISGTVDDIRVNEGEFVNMGMPVVRVVDLDHVEIEAELSEQYLKAVHYGDSVLVKMPALDIQQNAVINFVSQVINPDNRSFKIKVKLNNKNHAIKPNVLANMMIKDYQTNSAFVVPSIAINKDLQGDFVYVAVKDGDQMITDKKYIQRGKSFGDQTEIVKGLAKGDRIIISGFNQVNKGEPVELTSATPQTQK